MQFIVRCYVWCIDFLFPPTARSERASLLTELPHTPRTTLYGKRAVSSLMSYTHPDVRDAIQAAKFDACTPAHTILAHTLSDFLIDLACDADTKDPIVVIPIPLSTTRHKDRGYNQVEEVVIRTDAIKNRFASCNTTALVRTRDTPRQALATKESRRLNVKRAFSCIHPHEITHAHVVLVDDVITTGATMTEAARALAPHVRSLTCVALARA
jgi:ComF family protein